MDFLKKYFVLFESPFYAFSVEFHLRFDTVGSVLVLLRPSDDILLDSVDVVVNPGQILLLLLGVCFLVGADLK